MDLAGGDAQYAERLDEFIQLYLMRDRSVLKPRVISMKPLLVLSRTAALLDANWARHSNSPAASGVIARNGCREQCLEVCPTTYLKTGTLRDMRQLKLVFDRCFEAGVDIAICTDNAGLHNVRLPFEYENLLTLDIIGFEELQACQEAAFRHAFAWPHG